MTHDDFITRVSDYFKGQSPKLMGVLTSFVVSRIEQADLNKIYDHLITNESPSRTIGVKDIIDAAAILCIKFKGKANLDPSWPPTYNKECPACGHAITWGDGSDLCTHCAFPGKEIYTHQVYLKIFGKEIRQPWWDETVQKCKNEYHRKRENESGSLAKAD